MRGGSVAPQIEVDKGKERNEGNNMKIINQKELENEFEAEEQTLVVLPEPMAEIMRTIHTSNRPTVRLKPHLTVVP